MKRRDWISLFLLFHLFVIVIYPNRELLFSRWAAPLISPYVNFFEFSGEWNFFAPEPGPPPLYLEWDVQDEKGEELGTERFPNPQHGYFFLDRQNRRAAVARFMFSGEDRYIRVWGEYVCRENPRAHSVRLWRVVLDVPGMSDVAEGKKQIADYNVVERRSVGNVYCSDMRLR